MAPPRDQPQPPGRKPRYAAMEWTPEHVQRFWDYESQFPQRYYSFKYGAQIIDRALRSLGAAGCRPETTWLDFGCGYGSFTELLLGRGFGVVIHDLSPESLAECARRCGAHPNFRGTLADSDVPIDVVTLLEVVEHVDAETLAEIVASLRRSCPEGARLVLTTPNDEDLEAPDSVVYCPQCQSTRHRWQHIRCFTRQSLERELTGLGLRSVEVSEENFRRDKRLATGNPLRKLKRMICEPRLLAGGERPNLFAVAEL